MKRYAGDPYPNDDALFDEHVTQVRKEECAADAALGEKEVEDE